jgi:PAS domain S-box-containing protein
VTNLPNLISLLFLLAVAAIMLPLTFWLSRRARNAEKAIDSTNDGYWVLNGNADIVDVNTGYCNMVGYSRQQILQMCIADFEEVAMQANIRAQVRRILDRGHERFETQHRHADGHWVDLEITVTRVDSNHLVAFLRDISSRKASERALLEASRVADAANQAKSRFLANMSHEIRTPLNAVIGFTELMLETSLDPTQREYLSLVGSSADSLMGVLNDILDFSKIEAGKFTLETRPVALRQLLQVSVASLDARAQMKGLTLACHVDDTVPEFVLGDPGRLRQVLVNLCDNAVKFTNSGSVIVRASATASEQSQTRLQVSIEDTGIGIDPSLMATIFESFQQADTSITRLYGGSGLGLAICRNLLQLMGGTITVSSRPMSGSTFVIQIPLQLDVASSQASTSTITALVAATRPQRPLQVLLVEDNAVNQKLCTHMLESWGHVVTPATNGEQGLRLFAEQTWDLVLMDMQMPVMSGVEATHRMRSLEGWGKQTPIIGVTANAMASDKQVCLDAGMDDHLAKPYSARELRDFISRHVRQ